VEVKTGVSANDGWRSIYLNVQNAEGDIHKPTSSDAFTPILVIGYAIP